MNRLLVTGADGFVGGTLVGEMAAAGLRTRRAVRKALSFTSTPNVETVVVGHIDANTDWRAAVAGIETVVHLAARVHVLADHVANPLAAFREVNTQGTRRLASQAAAAGVKRFVYMSSIKVNGESTDVRPFAAQDVPAPVDAYGFSKLEAENAVSEAARGSGMQVVILRPPLVYGPNVRANFLRLLRLVDWGVPLPLGGVRNRRSLISVWNLCDLIRTCVSSDAASGQTFLASDGEDLSTPDLVTRIATAMDRSPRLFSVPPSLLRAAAAIVGKRSGYARLCGSLQVDLGHTRRTLGWSPPVTVDEALARTVNWYLSKGRSRVD